jgi:tetratricopeptide (TPR) repeat protein
MFKPFPSQKLIEFLSGKTILIVEPSMNYRTSIKQFLVNLKAPDVKIVGNIADAKRAMLTTRIGLFIVEWGLEDTNGLQYCRELRRNPQYINTPFLLLSVENLKQDVILASEVRIDGYLLKPFSYEDFCNQIQTILRNFATPGRVNALLDIADEKLTRGDIPGATTNLEKALELKPSSARALVSLAKIELDRGDSKKAKEYLESAISSNHEYIDAYRLRLEISIAETDKPSIIETAMFLHSLSPENPRYTLILAKTHLDLRQIEGSEQFFRKTIGLSPMLAEAYQGLGNVFMLKSEYEKAMKNFKKALDLDKDDISTLNSLGLALIRMGQYDNGIQKYMMALKIDPYDFRVLFNIGHAYEKKNNLQKAKWYYQQSLLNKEGYDKAARGLSRLRNLMKGKAS